MMMMNSFCNVLRTVLVVIVLMIIFISVVLVNGQSPQWTWEDPAAIRAYCIDMNSTGTFMAVGTQLDQDNIAHFAVFDWRSPWPIIHETYPHIIFDVAVSDSGSHVACVTGHELWVFDTSDGSLLWNTSTSSDLHHVDFDGNANVVMAAEYLDEAIIDGGTIYLFDMTDGDLIWSDQPGMHNAVAARIHECEISNDGTKIMAFFGTGNMSGPAYAALYLLDTPNPSWPAWILPGILPSHWIDGDMSENGEFFVMSTASYVYYFDLLPPENGSKPPLWTYYGIGVYTFVHNVSISDDGNITAHFGPYNNLYGDITYGGVDVIDGSNGALIWSQPMEFQTPEGQVSGNGNRVAYSGSFISADLDTTTYIYDLISDSIIWSTPTFGKIEFSYDGSALFVGAGVYKTTYTQEGVSFFRIVDNDIPECTITSPRNNDFVSGLTRITGNSSDDDGTIQKIEVMVSENLMEGFPDAPDFDCWHLDVNFSSWDPGVYEIKARAVDNLFKYGSWFSISITVQSPSATPTPTPESQSTQTPTCTPTSQPSEELTLILNMPSDYYLPGDTFRLDAQIWNPGEPLISVPLIVVLEIHGTFFFWPSWQKLESNGSGFDYALRDFPYGSTNCEIIPTFIWPQNVGQGLGLLFCGVLLDSDLSDPLCRFSFLPWSYYSQ